MSIRASLGPTNTGKTFYAIERMTSYKSGIIGLPLRLLTKEVFDKISQKVGPSRVAMITGEERIIPQNPKFWVCTVESMPTNIPVEFVAIDEIQLINDPERGYIFTEKLLQARGMHETLFMGSNTVEKVLKKIIPKIKILNRPRFSKLSYSGYKKITNLPRRSAVVAFSIDSVYSIAEIIRKNKGGVAIVMGALSPRTRNAQVEMYQNGEVDFIVATDAIGMGLNLDLNHVVFAENRKFDGKQYRNLSAHELGQIAGRAGRYQKNGTFGVTANVTELDIKDIHSIENHEFEKIKFAFWRNTKLNYENLESLIKSLETKSENHVLKNSPTTEDFKTLLRLAENDKIKLTLSNNNLKLFWDLCQIPDFRQNNEIYHLNLIENIYFKLIEKGKLTDSTLENYTKKLTPNVNDDIYSLSEKLAEIRTWSFVSNKKDWVINDDVWQEKTREIEDNLSESLHIALTERFVDTDSKKFYKNTFDEEEVLSGINQNGDVTVNGNYYGKIEGLRFIKDSTNPIKYTKKVQNIINATVIDEIKKRIINFINLNENAFKIDNSLTIFVNNEPIALTKKGKDILSPKAVLLIEKNIDNPLSQKLEKKINIWLKEKIENQLIYLTKLKDPSYLANSERGLAYRLIGELGVINRKDVDKEVDELNPESRRKLKKYGIKIGKYSVYISHVLKPQYTHFLPALWLNFHKDNMKNYDIKEQLDMLPKPGITSCNVHKKISPKLYKCSGYKIINNCAVRIDILERLDKIIYKNIQINKNKNQFSITDQMVSLLGTSLLQLKDILIGLGYIIKKEDKDCKKIIWFANIKKTRKLYKKNISKNVKSKNTFFTDSDLEKIRDKFLSK
tara:strand:+ start:767 stop:3304 length:2538 start_codon:yes stop_codon:yes gene_type:complete